MNNVERIARLVAKAGSNNILIHSIPGSRLWIVGQRFEEDNWLLTLMEPEKNVSFNLGSVSNDEHLQLWTELVNKETELRSMAISASRKAGELREVVKNFISISGRSYGKFTQVKETRARKIGRRIKKSSKRR